MTEKSLRLPSGAPPRRRPSPWPFAYGADSSPQLSSRSKSDGALGLTLQDWTQKFRPGTLPAQNLYSMTGIVKDELSKPQF